MALGEKIRYARKCCGLSQEQLAEKLCVSRSAIAKWETDKGLPDIENLKLLSRLLGISVDSLLDDNTDLQETAIRKAYHLSAYGNGCKKVKKDRMMRHEFPNAKIYPLHGRPILQEAENIWDPTKGALTPVPFGTPEFMKSMRNMDKAFYLVRQEDMPLFVIVSDDYWEVRSLNHSPSEKSFQLGNWLFIQGNALTEE